MESKRRRVVWFVWGGKNDKKSLSFYAIDNHCVSVLQSTFESILKLLLKNMTDFLVS